MKFGKTDINQKRKKRWIFFKLFADFDKTITVKNAK